MYRKDNMTNTTKHTACVLGIDTGGTTTDAVLYDPLTESVVAKGMAPTTRQDLKNGIHHSIDSLRSVNGAELSDIQIEKVVLSTTLATNAIVEGQGRPTGLILIGSRPKGELPTEEVVQITGKINIKGRETEPVDPDEIEAAVTQMLPKVEAIAVSGMMSVRNNAHELAVKKVIRCHSKIPVVCGHELSSKLGYHDRTVTTVLNASLIPIIEGFVQAVREAMAERNIAAPVYLVKGDGALASLETISSKPIETILSGPAASILGAMVLAKTDSGIVADMGGTTTDTGVVRHHSLTLSPVGAKVGQWQTQVDSAKLATFGLGGDTEIYPDVSAGAPVLTTHRVPPACRGGEKEDLTPTDLLCAEGSLTRWDTAASQYALAFQSRRAGLNQADYLSQAKALVVDRIVSKVFNEAAYSEGADAELPVIAIGAPAKTWYTLVKNEADVHRDILVPEHFEVANAVGAATAAIEERVDALVRPDEATEGYVAHVGGQSVFFEDKDKAVAYAKAEAGKIAQKQAESQGPETIHTDVTDKDIQQKIGWRWRYVETRVQAVARSGHLTLVPEEEKPAFEKNFD
jgi:N-methylhydantoinase A/oxoprolinase/acetone carboxylase beta subunit